MKVLIDGMNLSLSEGTGVATYARNLAAALKGMDHEIHVLYGENKPYSADPVAREAVFFDSGSYSKDGSVRRKILKALLRPNQRKPYSIPDRHVIKRPIAERLPPYDQLWNSRSLFTFARFWFSLTGRMVVLDNPMNADVAHWTYPMPIRLKGARNFYTVHDLVPLKLPYTTLDNKVYYAKVIRAIARYADKIVTVSETSRRDIVEMFEIPDDKVVNTYQSVALPESLTAMPSRDAAEFVRNTYGLEPGEYLMFYSAVEPKKNVRRMVEAYLSSQVNMPLVIAGKTGWLAEEALFYELEGAEPPTEKEMAKRRGPARRTISAPGGKTILRLTHLPLANLVQLVRSSRAVLFPSIYEGFGLPIVEAMLCGTPVLTSSIGAMHEIASDAALLVDPYDGNSIKRGIERIAATDPAERKRYAERGHGRARMFGEEIYRERLADLYGA